MRGIFSVPPTKQDQRIVDSEISYFINSLIISKPVLNDMCTATAAMIEALLPAVTEDDLQDLFPSDHFCVPKASTTVKRANSVFFGARNRLKMAVRYVERDNKQIFETYLGTAS